MSPKILMAFVGGAALAGVITMFVANRPAERPQEKVEAPASSVELPVASDVAKETPLEVAVEAPKPIQRAAERPSAAPKPVARVVAKPSANTASPAKADDTGAVTLPPFSTSTSNSSSTTPAPAPVVTAEAPRRSEILRPEAPKVPERVPETVTIAAGTTISVRLNATLSSDKNLPGDTFTAVLDQPLVVNDMVIAERGAKVDGKVVEAVKAGRVKGTALLSVALTRVRTSDGQSIAIATDPFVREGEKSVKSDAVKVGVGAAIGAAIGAIAGGGKGAAIGGASGGAAGTGVVLATRGKPVQLDVESKLPFRLAQAVTITEKIR